MAKEKNKTIESTEVVITEEMNARFSGIKGDAIKVAVITAGLIVVLVVLWLILG